jgi:hypothetical protein
MPIFPALGRLRQEDQVQVRPCLEKHPKNKNPQRQKLLNSKSGDWRHSSVVKYKALSSKLSTTWGGGSHLLNQKIKNKNFKTVVLLRTVFPA